MIDDIDNPLEPIKVQAALRSEQMKFEYRMKNNPKEINILDYTVMAALERQLPKKCVGLNLDSGRVDDDFSCCPNCNRILIEDYLYCPKCGQRIEQGDEE